MNKPSNDIVFKSIGVIHTPFDKPEGTPIQPKRSGGANGTVEVYPDYAEGLADLDGFSHIMLLYHLHKCQGYRLRVVPYMDTQQRGLFATRAPRRPNPIGVSVVRLEKIEDNRLHIVGVDMLDGTPLLDIKPYVPEFDHVPDFKLGWLTDVAEKGQDTSADKRFHK